MLYLVSNLHCQGALALQRMENEESRRFLVDYVGENVVLESLEETISFYYFGVMIFVMYLALNMFMCV